MNTKVPNKWQVEFIAENNISKSVLYDVVATSEKEAVKIAEEEVKNRKQKFFYDYSEIKQEMTYKDLLDILMKMPNKMLKEPVRIFDGAMNSDKEYWFDGFYDYKLDGETIPSILVTESE
jgi:arsenate reductase-like glutaredoxin family protein